VELRKAELSADGVWRQPSMVMSLGWKGNVNGGADGWSSAAAWTSERDNGPLQFSPGCGVTGGGRWPAVNGELLKDREAVGVVAPPFATTDGFPLG
jgi:hypothetical protein